MILTLLIPNYNGRHLLEKNLPTVYSSLIYAGIDYNIIIVDDASSDTSVEFINTVYPEIKVLKNRINKGFSYTCNRGIKEAEGDLLLLLNSDVKLTRDYIKKCIEFFKSKPDTFAVAGTIIDDHGKPQKSGVLFTKNLFTIKKTKNTDDSTTHFISGANSMFDLRKLKKTGGFNSIYSPYYFEDDDLSFRAYTLGWKSHFIKDAICYHIGAATIRSAAKRNEIKKIYFGNKFIFNYIHTKANKNIFDLKILFIDVIPKLIIGNFWVWKSYLRYRYKTRGLDRRSYQLKPLNEY